jgi:hypothetical protein
MNRLAFRGLFTTEARRHGGAPDLPRRFDTATQNENENENQIEEADFS